MSSIIDAMAGRWVPDKDVHPSINIWGRRFWAPGNIEGTYRGSFPTHLGEKPKGLYWLFNAPVTPQEP